MAHGNRPWKPPMETAKRRKSLSKHVTNRPGKLPWEIALGTAPGGLSYYVSSVQEGVLLYHNTDYNL
jgi:hypothetical protein